MPRPSVIAIHSFSLPVSPRRMAQTPNCIVKLDATRIDGQDRGERKVRARCPDGRMPVVRSHRCAGVEVGREEAAEEHHLAGDEEEHRRPSASACRSRASGSARGPRPAAPEACPRSCQALPLLGVVARCSSRSSGCSAACPCPWRQEEQRPLGVDRRQRGRSCTAAAGWSSPTRACCPPTGRRRRARRCGAWRTRSIRNGRMLARDHERADRREDVELRPARVRRVVGDAPEHARQAQQVHREEGRG